MKPTELPDNQRFHFEAALAGISDAVITTDSADRVVFINPAAQSMTGWTSMDAVGLPLTHVFRPIDSFAAFADDLIQASLVDQRGFRSAIEYRESTARDGAGNIVGKVVVARDITRRHAAEIALLANTDALFAEKERAQVTLKCIGEFVVLLADVHSAADACGCAAKILKALNAGLPVGDGVLQVSASIGIAMFPDHAADADTLMRHADAAMYRAKYTGRANYQMFSAEASASV